MYNAKRISISTFLPVIGCFLPTTLCLWQLVKSSPRISFRCFRIGIFFLFLAWRILQFIPTCLRFLVRELSGFWNNILGLWLLIWAASLAMLQPVWWRPDRETNMWNMGVVDTVDGRNQSNHLGCIKPCKYWDKLPYSTGAGIKQNPFHFRHKNMHQHAGIWVVMKSISTEFVKFVQHFFCVKQIPQYIPAL